jgi:hypothetical protein
MNVITSTLRRIEIERDDFRAGPSVVEASLVPVSGHFKNGDETVSMLS